MPAFKVNWKEIFNGKKHLLEKNIHFKTASSFVKYVYAKAKQYEVKIFPPKISDDGEFVEIQTRSMEIAVCSSSIKRPIESEIEPEVINNTKSLELIEYKGVSFLSNRRSNNSKEKIYPFQNWFAELVCGGQKEVEVNKLDDFGNPIPIMREFEGGFKAPTGQYLTEKKVVTFKPTFILTLKYPQDFICSPKKMAAIFCEAAKSMDVDVNKIHFDYSKKDKLIIRADWIAESFISREERPDQYNLWENFNPKEAIPLPMAKAEIWMDTLIKDGQLVLYKGHDYVGDGINLAGLLRRNFPDIEFYAKEEKDRELGWETLLLTIRKPMLARLDKNTTLKEWEEMEEGKLLEQQRDIQKLEIENNKLLENIGHVRLQYVTEIRQLTEDLNKLKDDDGVEDIKKIIEEKIKSTREDFIGLLGEEEILRIEYNKAVSIEGDKDDKDE